jgi:alkylhydroperoxidase/carboxymuconolactone decarboxylase family protein YurZ
MPHIPLAQGLPGIRGLFAFRPETAKPLCDLADVLLHGPGTLTPGERELIATYVHAAGRQVDRYGVHFGTVILT